MPPPSSRRRSGGFSGFLTWLFLALMICGPIVYKCHGASFPKTAALPVSLPASFPQVADDPVQTGLTSPPSFPLKGYTLTAVASYAITARILHTHSYFADRESDLSPMDLALGWGKMAESAVLSNITITQGGRFFHWDTPRYPIPREQIETESANTHIIPATDAIARQVKALRQGQVVTMAGYLVNIRHPDGWHWKTSLSRADTGAGACEVFYVQYVNVP
jgi:hypothetical protein